MQAQVRLTLWAAVAGHDSLNGPRPPQATERTARAASVHRCASQQAKHLLAYSPYGMMLLHLLEQVYGSLLIACGLQSCTACRHEQAAVRFQARHRCQSGKYGSLEHGRSHPAPTWPGGIAQMPGCMAALKLDACCQAAGEGRKSELL